MQRGDQQPRRDANAFGDVIILQVIACMNAAAPLPENCDQPGGRFE